MPRQNSNIKLWLTKRVANCSCHGLHTSWNYNIKYRQLTCRLCHKQRTKKFNTVHPFRAMLSWAKRHAKANDRIFSINESMILALWDSQFHLCALSGLKMNLKKRSSFKASIDRINPSRGYEPDNIQLVCSVLNRMKTDLNIIRFKRLCLYVSVYGKRSKRKGK
jgi:hypothetical protein